ncbi:MAG: lamin tail domain-containing protein [Chitinispirillaceae bacterium]|nr:lamin tail domain-containing protein [Chitinispirillaceae bacterium]
MFHKVFFSSISQFFRKRLSFPVQSRLLYFGLFASCSLLFSSCGTMPPAENADETGVLEIHSLIMSNGTAGGLSKLATTCDSLIVEVSGADIGTLRFGTTFDMSLPVQSDTISPIPAGTSREVRVFTVDRAGSVIHTDTVSHRSLRIDPNSVTQLTVVLFPASGSIYLQLENIPTAVDSIIASFTADDSTVWSVRAERSTKLYLSIDKIPHNTHGTLYVAAVDTLKDTLYSATKELTFSALSMQNITLTFSTTPGRIIMGMTVVLPGVTSATGDFAAPESSSVESGGLVITEIMYAANDSEYVEVYNPSGSDQIFDSLYIDIDGTYRLFTNITVHAGQAYVFGRRLLSWTDTAHSVTSALDLSAGGTWITVRAKDSSIIDRVIFTGGSNALEWPVVPGKTAIVLDAGVSDPLLNNFGRNWHAATALIPGTAGQYGTPKTR